MPFSCYDNSFTSLLKKFSSLPTTQQAYMLLLGGHKVQFFFFLTQSSVLIGVSSDIYLCILNDMCLLIDTNF